MTATTSRAARMAAAEEAEQAEQAERAKGWTPRRRGEIYCSPLCGGKCTHAAFEEAHRNAAALCERLGKGWFPRVWENMGWHYSAQKGVAEMHVTEYRLKGRVTTSYSVYFNSVQQTVASATSPEDALRTVARTLDVLMEDWRAVLE